MDTSVTTSPPVRLRAVPPWADALFLTLVVFVIASAVWILGGLGGPVVARYVAMVCNLPAELGTLVIVAAAARHAAPGAVRNAWTLLTIGLALFSIGIALSLASWLVGVDPFPGPADIFFCGFYVALAAAALFLRRASAVRVPWVKLSLDASIFVVGFGAFLWYLVVHPAGLRTEVNLLKEGLSQAYVALDCMILLLLGVLLLTRDGDTRIPRTHVLLASGFAILFVADIVWSLARMSGYFLPGGWQNVLYLCCYVPVAAAAREQLSYGGARLIGKRRMSGVLASSLPSAAMLAAFAAVVYFHRGDIAHPLSPVTTMVFVLLLLFVARQAVVLRITENRYASLIANASDAITIVRADGTLSFGSHACQRILGWKPDEITGRQLPELWAGEDTERLRAFLAEVAAASSGTVGPIELRILIGGEHRMIEAVGSNLTHDPAVRGLALNFRDISDRKVLEEQLRQMAFHDPLTLLANRNLFRDRVQHALTLAQRQRTSVAVMFLDLDNFKNINDSLGHDAGDRLLRTVAQRIAGASRSSDTVARLGGDEFAVLLEGIGSVADVEQLAEKLIRTLDRPFDLEGREVSVSASIGIASSDAEAGAEALLSSADIAMYNAKAAGKNRYVAFHPRMQDVLHERMRLEADIVRALAAEQFFLEYQPIVDLGSRSLLGVEALVRWRHPEFGVLMPARFIQVLEEGGHVARLGRWVLAHACREMCAWRMSVAGGSALRLAVNISGRHLEQGDLVQDVHQALHDSGLEPDNLVIELTESTIMDNTGANLERFRRLKALGVRLAIDDFGTGYSSLSYLHRFPIDILKIDRAFVSRLTNSDSGPELVRTVVTLSETLGLDTVAEGIEQEAQATALLGLGCVAGQGFLFAPASSLAELGRSPFVARRRALWTAQAAREELSATGRFKALEA